MSQFLEETLQPHFNFWIYVILMMIGLWAVIAKNNFIKKLIGLSIFQTAIILLYVSLGVKEDATIPILDHHGSEPAAESAAHGHAETHDSAPHPGENEKHDGEPAGQPKPDQKTNGHGHAPDGHHAAHAPDPDTMANPLPHVLMLTAIVVGVATLGVALALAQMVFREFGTLEEDEILDELQSGSTDA